MDDNTPLPLGARSGNHWSVCKTRVDMTRPPRPVRPLDLQALPRDATIDAAKTAPLIIDMQNDFCTKGGWLDRFGVDFAPACAPIAPSRNQLPALRAAGIPVIWVNWGNRPDKLNLSAALLHVCNPDGRSVGLDDPLLGSGARVLERGSWAAAVVDELETVPGDVRIDKYRMSGFRDTPLDSVLKNLGITTLLFGGVNVDQCVLATPMDANFLGYDCIMLEDCAATTSPRFCRDATVYNVKQCFGFVTGSDQVLAGLAR